MATTREGVYDNLKAVLATTPSIGGVVWAGEQPTALPCIVIFRESLKRRERRDANFTRFIYRDVQCWVLFEPQPTMVDATGTTVDWDDAIDAHFRGNVKACGVDTSMWLESIEVTRRTYLGHAYSCLVCRATVEQDAYVVNTSAT